MDIEKVKWMFTLRASDSGTVELLLLILNIPQVEQEISLTYLQTKHFLFRGGGGFFSFTLPKHFCVFSGKFCCNETTTPRDLSGGHGSSFDGESFCRRLECLRG
ncbi:uncharacterized protein G2W53_015076 [Senna tora]|uniref:Uncharacterized protein n=1 Tax=Senna tora TaxID=362788 RepID=A0A834WUV8_9FABA|nr:uncharacterized protein G2W53_015076 [Senna tora]